RRRRPGELAFVPPLLLRQRVWDVRRGGLPPLDAIDDAAGGEEPQPIAGDRAAGGVLEGRNDIVDPRVVRVRRQRAPVVVRERGPERAAEAVAARLRDRV